MAAPPPRIVIRTVVREIPAPLPVRVTPASNSRENPPAYVAWQNLAGCTAANAEELRGRLRALDDRRHRREDVTDVAIARELAAMWKHPCLAHVARYAPAPVVTTNSDQKIREFMGMMQEALRVEVGGFYTQGGETYFVLPPSLPALLDAATMRALTPFFCPESEQECGHAATYVTRANAAFEAEHAREAWSNLRYAASRRCTPEPDEDHRGTPFEVWVECLRSSADVTYQYPALRFRAPTRGWLWIRGRRGHYGYSDEIRAYDLSSGAAYVAGHENKIFHQSSDEAAAAAEAKPRTQFGNVALEAVRELAFVLVTAAAPTPRQEEPRQVVVPSGVAVSFTPGASKHAKTPPAASFWSTSGHTELAWELVDGKTIAKGRLQWPSAWHPPHDHADRLIEAVEAGLELGCAHATLPPLPHGGDGGYVSAVDAAPGQREEVMVEVAQALESLRGNTCPVR